ncbi:MAG TPA: hypothetical protein VK879_08920 [Candidatus Sulfomarinibacteraceae bacterium]|nr:hypothetical protein [Candidatus Sulfomarinibacteraceae bacterium]
MKKITVSFVLLTIMIALLVIPVGAQGTDNPDACWGQASAVFAQTGEMGEHASQEETPRIGLRNLARQLYEADLLPDDSLQSLGQFVVAAWELEVDACLE